MICAHRPCENEVPEGHEKFCSPKCRKRAKHKRSPSVKKRRAARRREQFKRPLPYPDFIRASVGGKRISVKETPEAQAQARQLVAAGLCAYENRKGQIRDVGEAKKPEDRGRVFRFEQREQEAA